jgi:HK97 family phage prohead protease
LCGGGFQQSYAKFGIVIMMALQGVAVHYNHVIKAHRGEHKMVLPGAFDGTLDLGAPVEFRLTHHDGPSIGKSPDYLELISNNIGLMFRFRFPDTELGREGLAIAETRVPTTLSVGFGYNNALKYKRVIDGLCVMVIERAWLHEVTWLTSQRGADERAFASYENIDDRSLRKDIETGKMACDGAAVEMTRALKNLANAIAAAI